MQFSKALLPLLVVATSGVISAPTPAQDLDLAVGNMLLLGRDMHVSLSFLIGKTSSRDFMDLVRRVLRLHAPFFQQPSPLPIEELERRDPLGAALLRAGSK